MIRSLSDLRNKNIKGKVFLVRIDTNVPVEEGRVTNDFRLRSVMLTLEFLLKKEARVVLMGHMEPAFSSTLKPVSDHYRGLFPASFVGSCDPEDIRFDIEKLKDGNMIVLENLRSLPFEKENDEEYARALASLGDAYVNEAFSVSHREHASIVGLPRHLPSFAGMRFERETEELAVAFDPGKPFLFVLGGLKFKTKAPLIEKFVEKADAVFVGGALANSFFKQKGFEVGKSATDEGVDLKGLLHKENLILPFDVVVENKEGDREIKKAEEVSSCDSIVDVGPLSMEELSKKIKRAAFIVWNGPMGNIEKGYDHQTKILAEAIATSDAHSVIGGGDTISSIEGVGFEGEFSFVSTGGGAMLDFLIHETLPGIEALKDSPDISF